MGWEFKILRRNIKVSIRGEQEYEAVQAPERWEPISVATDGNFLYILLRRQTA